MIWFLFQKIGFFLFLFLTIKYVIQKNYFSLLVLYFFGLVFANCFQFFITIWFPTKIVSLGMLLSLLQFPQKLIPIPKNLKRIIFAVCILVIIGNFVSLFFPGEIRYDISPYSRLVLQDLSYITSAFLLFYIFSLKPTRIFEFYKKYCFVIEIAIFFGLVHYIFILIGVPFAPIMRANDYTEFDKVIAIYNDIVVNRIYAFSGEPKNLGFTIAPYLMMSFFMFITGNIRKSRKYHLTVLLIGSWVLYNTFSSSALIAVVLSFVVILINYRTRFNSKLFGLTIISISVLLISYLYIQVSDFDNPNQNTLVESFYDRTFGRAANELENDRQETVIWNTFKNEDVGHLLFGYGPGQYTFHVPGQIRDGVLVPVQSGFILTMVDFGIIGIAGFLIYGFLIFNLLRKSRRRNDNLASAFFIATMVSYIGSLMYGNMTTSFIYFMIAIYTYEMNKKKTNIKFDSKVNNNIKTKRILIC